MRRRQFNKLALTACLGVALPRRPASAEDGDVFRSRIHDLPEVDISYESGKPIPFKFELTGPQVDSRDLRWTGVKFTPQSVGYVGCFQANSR